MSAYSNKNLSEDISSFISLLSIFERCCSGSGSSVNHSLIGDAGPKSATGPAKPGLISSALTSDSSDDDWEDLEDLDDFEDFEDFEE